MMNVVQIYLFYATILAYFDKVHSGNCTDYVTKSEASRLTNDLFCSYNRNVRPVLNQKTQTMVNTTMYFFSVHMDEEWNVLKMSIHLILTWKDEFLTWDPLKYDNVEYLHQSSSSVWLPNIMSYDSGFDGANKDFVYDLPISTVKITNKGIIKYNHRVNFDAFCSTNIANWPFDEHNCTVIMGSPLYTNLYVNFTFPDGYYSLDFYNPDREWKVKNIHHECYTLQYFNSNNSYDHCLLQYTIIVERFSSMYFSSVIIPAIVISLMSAFTFLLGPEIIIRVILLCLFFVSELLYIQFLDAKIPNNGSHPVYIVLLYRNCLIQTAMAILLSVISNSFHKRGLEKCPRESPDWLKSLSSFLLSKRPISLLTNLDMQGAELLMEKNIEEESPNRKNEESALFWIKLSVMLDRLSFIITLIAIVLNFIFAIP